MGKRVTTWLDQVLDAVHWRLVLLGYRQPETTTSADFHILLLGLVLLLCLHPLICYFTVARSPHVTFWMGTEVRQMNLLVPVTLLSLIVALFLLQWFQARQKVVRGAVLLLFISAGGILALGGVRVLQLSHAASTDLVYHCGSGNSLSQRMESEWLRLSQFQKSCVAELGRLPRVELCPGFPKMLAAPHAIFAGYVQELEMDFGCSGFCRFWATPLFNFNAEAGKRCASAVGEHMVSVGSLVALPTLVSGVGLAMLGLLLVNYDHL